MFFWFTWESLPNQVSGRILCLTTNSRKYEAIVSVRPYPCQCHNRIRRGCPAGDDETGFMPVDAQDVRCWIMRLHKQLLRICGMKKNKKKQNEWYLKYSSVRSCISKQMRPLTFCPLGEPWFAQIHSCCTEGAVMLQLRLAVQLNQSNVIQSNSISDHFIPFFFLKIFLVLLLWGSFIWYDSWKSNRTEEKWGEDDMQSQNPGNC